MTRCGKEKKMQRRFLCLAVTLSVFCTSSVSLADTLPLAPRAAIQAAYDHLYSLARHKDLTGAVRYFATDFRSEDRTNPLGSKTPPMNLVQLRQVAADYAGACQSVSGHATVQRLVVTGSQATATVVHHVVVVGMPDARTGKRFHGVFDATTQDTWKLGPQGWQMERGCGFSLKVKRHEN